MQTDLRKAVRVNSTVDRSKTVQGHKNTPTQKHTPQTPTHLDIHLFTSIHPHTLSTQTPTTTQLHAYPHSPNSHTHNDQNPHTPATPSPKTQTKNATMESITGHVISQHKSTDTSTAASYGLKYYFGRQ